MLSFFKDNRTPEQKEALQKYLQEQRESYLIERHSLDQNKPYIVIEVNCMTSLGKKEFEEVVGLAISRFGYAPVGSVEFTKAGAFDTDNIYRQALTK